METKNQRVFENIEIPFLENIRHNSAILCEFQKAQIKNFLTFENRTKSARCPVCVHTV